MQSIADILSEMPEIKPQAWRIEPTEGDSYDADGLLCCGMCGRHKETRLTGFLDGRIVPCSCRCDEAAYEREQAERDNQERLRKVAELKRYSLMDGRQQLSTFDRFCVTDGNRRNYEMAQRYVRQFDSFYKQNKGLLFMGDKGTGKTYLAACIANALMDAQVPVFVTSIIKLTGGSKDNSFGNNDDTIIATMNQAKLLVLDDLGTESPYKAERVYSFINSRYMARKPTIITTNLTLDQLKNAPGIEQGRVYDRILEMCHPVQFQGQSWRVAMARDEYKDTERMLFGDREVQ